MDDCSFFSFFALFLEFEILLKDWSKAVALQHAGLVHNGILVCRKVLQVVEQRDIVTWEGTATSFNNLHRALMKAETSFLRDTYSSTFALNPPKSPRGELFPLQALAKSHAWTRRVAMATFPGLLPKLPDTRAGWTAPKFLQWVGRDVTGNHGFSVSYKASLRRTKTPTVRNRGFLEEDCIKNYSLCCKLLHPWRVWAAF